MINVIIKKVIQIKIMNYMVQKMNKDINNEIKHEIKDEIKYKMKDKTSIKMKDKIKIVVLEVLFWEV